MVSYHLNLIKLSHGEMFVRRENKLKFVKDSVLPSCVNIEDLSGIKRVYVSFVNKDYVSLMELMINSLKRLMLNSIDRVDG